MPPLASFESLAVVTSLAAVVGAARSRVWSWPMGIVGVSAYAVVFFRARLYADLGLQGVFFVQNVMGWVAWHRAGGAAPEVPVRSTSLGEWVAVSAAVPAVAALLGHLLASHTNASVPWADASLTSLSLAANVLLMRRAVGNWLLWLAANAGYVALFTYKGLVLSAGLYAMFLALALWGWLRWRRELAGGAVPALEAPAHSTG